MWESVGKPSPYNRAMVTAGQANLPAGSGLYNLLDDNIWSNPVEGVSHALLTFPTGYKMLAGVGYVAYARAFISPATYSVFTSRQIMCDPTPPIVSTLHRVLDVTTEQGAFLHWCRLLILLILLNMDRASLPCTPPPPLRVARNVGCAFVPTLHVSPPQVACCVLCLLCAVLVVCCACREGFPVADWGVYYCFPPGGNGFAGREDLRLILIMWLCALPRPALCTVRPCATSVALRRCARHGGC